MKKLSLILLVLMLAFTVVLTACGGGKEAAPSTEEPAPAEKPAAEEPAADQPNTELSGEITIWSWFDEAIQVVLPGFNKKYPNIKVNSIKMEWGETHEKGVTTLAAGTGAPDILMIDNGRMAEFNTIEGLDDLLQPPYNAGRYKADFPQSNWDRYLSLDGKRLLAFPWDLPPAVTWYRTDVLEEAGFPSDPDELGTFMEDPDNFLSMAQTLKAQDKYLLEWNNQILNIFLMGYGFFDRDLNYLRNDDYVLKALDLAKKGAQLQLGANVSMWSDEGKQAMNAGKLAMIYSGSWMGNCCLKDPLKETSGKWRVAKLPFGVYGGWGGSSYSIPSQGKNKELAWAFIEYALATLEGQEEHIKISTMPGWKPAWDLPTYGQVEVEFLGGQKANLLYAELVEKIPPVVRTPLDAKAQEIWNKGIGEAIEKNLDSKAALQKIADDIEAAVANDKAKLLEARK
jgi:multiple sugar transport system substrate-binding protein